MHTQCVTKESAMSEMTNRLNLPYIMPAQAMKHVTHNEALQRLDASVQLAIDFIASAPPEEPVEGLICWVDEDAEGDFLDQSGNIAFWQDDAWQFITPLDGWLAWFKTDERLRVFASGNWQELELPETGEFDQLGVGASPDATNRFALSSDACLLNHGSGGGHQLKINKLSASHTASLLFQAAWSGYAEMGLAGNNAFSIKQSPDGSNWFSGLTISDNGIVRFPSRPLAIAGHSTASVTFVHSDQSGFSSLDANQGGFALGTTISGSMQKLVIPTSGFYLTLAHLLMMSTGTHGAYIDVNNEQKGESLILQTANGEQSLSSTQCLYLEKDDEVCLGHIGSGTIEFGPGKSTFTLIHIG